MKVQLPYTKDSFDADVQNKFLSAVANSVRTSVGNVYILSVVEKTSSRRVLRQLLAAAVEVELGIRVEDTAAQTAMLANEGLTQARLNDALAKQAFLVSACASCALLAARRGAVRRERDARVLPVFPQELTMFSRGCSPPRSRNRRHRGLRRLHKMLLIVPCKREACSLPTFLSICIF
jgi:hypothetical protein